MELICRAYWCKHNDLENEKCLLDRIVIDDIASGDPPLCMSYEDEDEEVER